MRKLTLLIIALLSSILSQEQVTETPVKLEDALLWEISGNGLQKSSYLLGTMHTVEFSFMFDSIPGMRKVLSVVEQVATEMDMMALDSIRRKTPTISNDYFLMPSDTTYSMLYNTKDLAFVDSVLSSGNPRYAERVPAFWQNIYSRYIVYNRIKKDNCMDYFLLRLANTSSKKTYFLETLQDIVDNNKNGNMSEYEVGLKEQASSLLFILKNTDMIRNGYNLLDSIYRARQLSRLSFENLTKELMALNGQVTEADFNKSYLDEYKSKLIKERNDAWMLKIPVIIYQGSTLIAVGAMHLPGNAGLINQLRKMGYNVKPYPCR